MSKATPWMQERFIHIVDTEAKKEDNNELVQQKVMDWAKELQRVSEVSFLTIDTFQTLQYTTNHISPLLSFGTYLLLVIQLLKSLQHCVSWTD